MNTIIVLLILILAVLILIYLSCCRNKSGPSTQVVNNSGALFHMVKVGGVEFTENLNKCSDGCSTGFITVPEGGNHVFLQETSGGAWVDLGELGTFERKVNYAVNIRNAGGYCAELWVRHQTSTTFNDDTTRTLIATNCP